MSTKPLGTYLILGALSSALLVACVGPSGGRQAPTTAAPSPIVTPSGQPTTRPPAGPTRGGDPCRWKSPIRWGKPVMC
jgi:hypothetical protein